MGVFRVYYSSNLFKGCIVNNIVMVSVKINFRKKDFVWVSLVIVLIGVGFSVAFGGTEPAVMGHSIGELEGVQKMISGSCAGQVMVGVAANGSVICEDGVGVGG